MSERLTIGTGPGAFDALRILDAAAEAAREVPDGYALREAVLCAVEALRGEHAAHDIGIGDLRARGRSNGSFEEGPMKTVDEIREERERLPQGRWFWRVYNGRLSLFRKHPVLGGWRTVLEARRLGMDGATLVVADPAVAPEDPSNPWESCDLVRVTRETYIPDLAVMRWIAEAPEHVSTLLDECDRLSAEVERLSAELERRAAERREEEA